MPMSGAREQSGITQSTSQLGVTLPSLSASSLSAHVFGCSPQCSELRINSNLSQNGGEDASTSSWRLESIRKSGRPGDTNYPDFLTPILQLSLRLEKLKEGQVSLTSSWDEDKSSTQHSSILFRRAD